MSTRAHTITVVRAVGSRLVRTAALTGFVLSVPASALAQHAGIARAAHRTHGNAVTDWNRIATDAFAPTQGTNPMAQSRILAILHAAIHDALNAIDRRFTPYTAGVPEARGSCGRRRSPVSC